MLKKEKRAMMTRSRKNLHKNQERPRRHCKALSEQQLETKFSRSAVVVVFSEVGGRNLLIVVVADPLVVGTLACDSGIGTGPTREVKLEGEVRAVVVAVPVDASSDEV